MEWEVIAKTDRVYVAKKHEYIMVGMLYSDGYGELIEWNLSTNDQDLDWDTSLGTL